eukprot:6192999-Pleurochrysis_carterae.AAC.1
MGRRLAFVFKQMNFLKTGVVIHHDKRVAAQECARKVKREASAKRQWRVGAGSVANAHNDADRAVSKAAGPQRDRVAAATTLPTGQ